MLTTFEFIPAPEKVARHLAVAPGTLVIHWRRTMSFDGHANGFDDAYVPRLLFPNLTPEHFLNRPKDKSIYAIYEDSDNIVITNSTDVVSAFLLNDADAALLGLPAGIPMFRLQRVSWDVRRRSVEYRIEDTDARSTQLRIGG